MNTSDMFLRLRAGVAVLAIALATLADAQELRFDQKYIERGNGVRLTLSMSWWLCVADGRAYAGGAMGLGFEHSAEDVVAKSALLLEVNRDIGE